MYLFNENIIIESNQREMAKRIGIAFETLNRILKRKQHCSKIMAYCITKALNKDAEIDDYFTAQK